MNKPEFVKLVQGLAGLNSKEETEKGIRIVFDLLSHRLTPEEAADAKAQLPADLAKDWASDLWTSNFLNISKHFQLKYRKKEEFYALVEEKIAKANLNIPAGKLIDAVFNVLKEQISEGESKDIASQLPKQIEEIWQAA